MSHGRIMRIKKEESSEIDILTKEFFKNGGKVKKIDVGVSGVDKPKRSFSI